MSGHDPYGAVGKYSRIAEDRATKCSTGFLAARGHGGVVGALAVSQPSLPALDNARLYLPSAPRDHNCCPASTQLLPREHGLRLRRVLTKLG